MALALASSSAAALGLGQLELKSKLGEPLVAEIRIISNDPAELERLRAGLASPETFARIGLEPPRGVVANLQFVSALDASGRPVIRVTSSEPIQQPLLTFLVEVDWGQGRLVREYSALLDAPRTVSAPMQPPIEAPVLAPSNTIVREPEPLPPEPEAEAEPADPVAATPAPAEEAPQPSAITPTAPPPAPVVAPGSRPRTTEYGAVLQGETLSEIASSLDLGVNLDQAMIALLNANPDAFIDGNVNLLRQGAVLRVPDRDEMQATSVAQAMAQVREQTRAWRAMRAPTPQPVLADAAPAPTQADQQTAAAPVGTTTADARLEIVPPGAGDASQAGNQSGTSAGGEGDTMRQDLQQTRETLAARDAELAELQSRVAELEKLQSDQQKLLEMKGNELNAVQAQLANADKAEQAARGSGLPWVLGGAALLLLALLGGWWMRRRPAAAPSFRPKTAPPSPLAAGFPGATAVPAAPAATMPRESPASDVADEPAVAVQPLHASPAPVPATPPQPAAVPTWHPGSAARKEPAAPVAPHIAPGLDFGNPPEPSDSEAPGRERLELARAYLDLGDRDSARQLLDEVVIHGDLAARQEAARMLRDLD
ncbi:hypothetical protein N799_10110 [Lysobacter arseniciresistens ZS79]|uniref:FimV N-terminal domain-containing protein n=1 Tax=Lysobacter arseniciresistens ZS79 TaxID=913325 RepID=A0A0A0F732_9GAMM|nr:hypothetical protein N799_10110 [Lysobacter arseniciresistens ZS79]